MIISNIDIIEYLEEVTGESITLSKMDMDHLNGLSLHLRKGYQLYKVQLLDRELILAVPQGGLPKSPKQAGKIITAISTQVNNPVALVLDHLPSYLRSRYVAQRIPFVVPGQQLFLPRLLIDLRSHKGYEQAERYHFRPGTQCMILYHLLVETIDGMLQEEIADRLGYSAMTISRAVKECRDKRIIQPGSTGIQFIEDKLELWQESKTFLRSPVRKIRYTDETEWIQPFMVSGNDALAHYTDMASEHSLSVAVSQSQYRDMENLHLDKIDHNHGTCRIEVWEYDPQLLSNNKYVDPLSLYLSIYNDNIDARTSKALDQLINYIHD